MNSRSGALFCATFLLLFAFVAGCYFDAGSQVEHANVAFDVSPGGEQVVFASADGDLFLFDLNAGKVRQLTKTAVVESTPAYSPDEKFIAFASTTEDQQGSSIFRILLDDTGSERLTKDADVFDRIPKYSSNGSRIAFARAHRHRPYSMGGWTWDDWDVYVMDADGTNVTRLTRNNYYGISGVEFSPSDKTILFSADNNRDASDLHTNVFEVSVDGSGSSKVGVPQPTGAGEFAAWASEPDFSPSGEKMVVISDRASSYQYDLVLIDVASGDAKSLLATSVSRYNQQPEFHPDGKRVLFLAGRESNAGSRAIFSLWSIEVDGTNAKEIADNQLFTDPSKWSPPK